MNKSLSVNLISIFAAVVLTAFGTYLITTQFSTPDAQDGLSEIKTTQSAMPAVVIEESKGRSEPVDVLLVGLKQRLAAQKDDVDGWILLSKSYYHLNRLEEAEKSFEQAKALGYAGNWMPIPRIDSFIQNDYSSQSLKSMIGSRDHEVGENSNQ